MPRRLFTHATTTCLALFTGATMLALYGGMASIEFTLGETRWQLVLNNGKLRADDIPQRFIDRDRALPAALARVESAERDVADLTAAFVKAGPASAGDAALNEAYDVASDELQVARDALDAIQAPPDATTEYSLRLSHVALAAAVLPVLWLWFWLRTRRTLARARAGLCVACGYDLRATPGRCPECGAVPATARCAAGPGV
jgi:membrane-associated phospholipid phosphatase